MTSFGERLRKEREARSVTLEEISASTKIRKRYLEALEGNEFGELPGGVFAKGYVRNYAQALGLDPESVLRDYLRERRVRGEVDPTEDEQAGKEAAQAVLDKLAAVRGTSRGGKGPVFKLAVLGVVAVAAVVLVWGMLRFVGRERVEPANAASGTPVQQPAGEERRPRTLSPRVPTPSPQEQLDASRGEAAREGIGGTIVGGAPAAGEIASDRAVPETPSGAGEAPPSDQAIPPRASAPDTSSEFRAGATQLGETAAITEETGAPRSSLAVPTGVESSLSIPDFGVGTGVVNRRLVGQSDRFQEGTVVWFWTRVLGGRAGEAIRHVWLHEGRVIGVAELDLGGPHWRTQSRRPLPPGSTGDWTVEARDADERVLARAAFRCVSEE